MSAPKSDTATIEARKNRLLELLAEGKNQQQAAEILRLERYPADDRTVRRDVTSLRVQWGEQNMNQFEQWRDEHIAELEALRLKLLDPTITPSDKIALALAIIREDSKIKGTAAATKSISANVNVEQQVIPMEQQLEYLNAFAGLYEDERLEELDRVKARKRTCRIVMDANVFQKALPESGS
jgi:hypothetical protein